MTSTDDSRLLDVAGTIADVLLKSGPEFLTEGETSLLRSNPTIRRLVANCLSCSHSPLTRAYIEQLVW